MQNGIIFLACDLNSPKFDFNLYIN